MSITYANLTLAPIADYLKATVALLICSHKVPSSSVALRIFSPANAVNVIILLEPKFLKYCSYLFSFVFSFVGLII